MTSFPHLFSPIQLGRFTIRNRVVVSSHGASESVRNTGASPTAYIEYLRRRAANAGLIIVQPVWLEPGGAMSEETVHRHADLADAVHAEGAAIILQIAHLGVYARTDADLRRGPLPGFQGSQSAMGETAHAMTDGEIEAMIDSYRRSAEMAAAAGLDGVEIHGAHGYLVQQSLTPAFNARDDRWGRDRTLFARRVLTAAREAIGADRVLSYRTPTDDLRATEDGGIGVSGLVKIVQELLNLGEIDVLNTTIGHGGESYARAIPSYRYDAAPNIPPLTTMRAALGSTPPVIGVGRIASVALAESLLEQGKCDLVAMTRAHIADPEIVAKSAAGQAHRVRPCLGANVCVNRKLQGYPEISCFHNPEVLRELSLEPRPSSTRKRVLVIGAGPAGLKAAVTGVLCGHDVVVADAQARPGGLLRMAEHTAAFGLASSLDYLLSELTEHGVTVTNRTTVDAEMLQSIAPDRVILATGARFTGRDRYPDAADGVVLSTSEALTGEVGERVLVYDAIGGVEAGLVVEALAKRGKSVTFVSTFETVLPWAGALHRAEMVPMLHQRAAQIMVGSVMGDVDGRHVMVVRPDGTTIGEFDVDTIVAVGPPQPRLELVSVLEGSGIAYQVVGDALAPRDAVHAFKEGHEAALAI
jgi:2,4-dienoyl-CoA reductase-like NADH-dependent reductase (Old Yellow Enzyme family)/thioredoxin reductase